MRPTKSQGDYEHCKNTSEEFINDQISQIIQDLTMPKDILQCIKPELEKMLNSQKSIKKLKEDALKKELDNIEAKLEEILSSYISGSITQDQFNKIEKSIGDREVKTKMNSENCVADKRKKIVAKYDKRFEELWKMYDDSETEEKTPENATPRQL